MFDPTAEAAANPCAGMYDLTGKLPKDISVTGQRPQVTVRPA